MKNFCLAGAVCLSLSGSVNAADLRDQLNVQTGKAELVIPSMSPQEVAEQIEDALSQFAIPAHLNFRTLPSDIPARPDEPTAKQVYVQGAPAIEYQCRTAYAEITKRPPPVQNPFYFNAESLQACLYPFQNGIKVYLVFTVARKTESLTSGLFNGITKAIRGSDGERITDQLNENISAIRKNLPTVLVERLEAPGMPVQEPDKAAVAALIPAKVEPVAAAPAPVQVATAPAPVATPAPAPASVNTQQMKIEARKNLTAMGMTYHSQEHFIAAIRRKDDVAVQLFIDGEGIDPLAREKNGKTPLEVAQEIGAIDVARIISNKVDKPASNAAPAAAAPTGKAASAAPAGAAKALDAAAASLPPELVAQINQQVDALNVPADQKEAMRNNAIRQLAEFRALAQRIDPETGRLK